MEQIDSKNIYQVRKVKNDFEEILKDDFYSGERDKRLREKLFKNGILE